MRNVSTSATAVVICLLAMAGCAQQSAGPATSGVARSGTASNTAVPSLAASASPGTAHACATAAPLVTRLLTITAADNGKVFCVTAGTAVVVLLRGTPGDMWMPIRSSSVVLAPRANPRLMLQAGVTGAAFAATRPGVATIASVRYPCRRPGPAGSAVTAASAAPPVHCGAVLAFRVSVVVEAR